MKHLFNRNTSDVCLRKNAGTAHRPLAPGFQPNSWPGSFLLPLDVWTTTPRPMVPSIKYVTLFWPIFTPSPCHTSSHIPGPPESTSHISDPRFLEGLVQKTTQKPPCTNSVSIVPGGFCPGVLSGCLLSGRFCPGWFLSLPVLSEYICYIRKLNITLNFMLRMYDKKFISVTSHALNPLPLSQTVTPSRTLSPLERDVLYGRPHGLNTGRLLISLKLQKVDLSGFAKKILNYLQIFKTSL